MVSVGLRRDASWLPAIPCGRSAAARRECRVPPGRTDGGAIAIADTSMPSRGAAAGDERSLIE
jgi:hypothetical protein